MVLYHQCELSYDVPDSKTQERSLCYGSSCVISLHGKLPYVRDSYMYYQIL
jgi:hypothetical protein